MTVPKSKIFAGAVWCLMMLAMAVSGPAQIDAELLKGMKARSLGPAGMSGRIAAIDAVVSNPDVIYVGAATGGVWKSTNGGITWKPIFDEQPVASIGAVAVFQPNPDIVWVGTGEGNPRNSSSVGNGVYKSLDGGETWHYLGLMGTEKIHRIILHPTDPNIAYVAALGPTWGESPWRGVFKTTDGGKTWKKILFVNEKTGCADLVMDPKNPNKLFAAMWQHRRWPWYFQSGGPGSGLYVTYDGGETWKKLTSEDGLPEGDLGRIGLAIARSNPDVVYALIEAKKNVLCRSDDGGKSWRVVNKSPNIAPRPFYFADIRVDPENENRLYNLHNSITVSEDGGKTFKSLTTRRVHPDHHALWIHPENGRFMINGNDGGIYISRDRGKTWRFVETLPLAQFYHISVDNEIPYNIYGGMQDNGSWRGPSDVWENGGIRNYHWKEVGFGDGFATLADPNDPTIGYSMSQGGFLRRFNTVTGERKDIRPWGPDTVKLRFNWNAAIAIDPFDPNVIYYGSQFVHMSPDRGDTWRIISPDLTTNDPTKQKQHESGGLTRDVTAAENYTSILTIAPSPVQKGVIWVGTDDGQVHVTTDGGNTWKNLTSRIPKEVPPNTWCPHIEASKFEADAAYIVFDDHRRNNWKTYVFKVSDFGRKWTSLTRNDPTEGTDQIWGYAHVIEQDPVKKELLFLGTEFGLWVSFDEGRYWMKWTQGLPTVAVRDLVVHPRDHDLVIGTHGRAAYVIDDIRPLRELTETLRQKPLHVFDIPRTYQHVVRQPDGFRFTGDALFRGESRPYGALITYWIRPDLIEETSTQSTDEAEAAADNDVQDKKKPKVKIEILDASGQVIRKMDGPMEKGINRVSWDLRTDGFKFPSLAEKEDPRTRRFRPRGPEVLPGSYTVKIKMGSHEAQRVVEVLPDPRVEIPLAERKAKFEMLREVGEKIEVVSEAINRIKKVRRTMDQVMEQVKDRKDEQAAALKQSVKKLRKRLMEVATLFVDPPDREGIHARDRTVIARLGYVARSLSSSYDRPTEAQKIYYRQALRELEKALTVFNEFFEQDVTQFRKAVEQANIQFIPQYQPLDVNWKADKK